MSTHPTLSIESMPLVADCDGTLIRTDLLHEAVFRLMKHSPFSLLQIPLWLLRGKAHLKTQIADRVSLDPAALPYNEDVLDYLREAKEAGRKVVLATASHRRFADDIAAHLGLFDQVVATDNGDNVSGKRKAETLCALFGEGRFEYAGNATADLEVWKRAGGAAIVEAPKSVVEAVSRICPVTRKFDSGFRGYSHYFKALRLHQWLKNALVFLPLLAAHRMMEPALFGQAVLAFLAYGLCASSVYLLNDLLDLPADRAHPRKKMRPFASGALPIAQGAMLIPLLLLASALFSWNLPPLFAAVLGAYYLTTLAYSISLKTRVILDLIVLATLYTFRIIAGAVATGVSPSFWLLAFSMFLFLSLATVKRYSELLVALQFEKHSAAGRGYRTDDLPLLLSMGSASGLLSILIMAMYVNSPDVNRLYAQPQVLWLMLPLLLYWICRIWMKTHRGEMHDDPVVFAVQDRLSLITGAAAAVVAVMATVGFGNLGL